MRKDILGSSFALPANTLIAVTRYTSGTSHTPDSRTTRMRVRGVAGGGGSGGTDSSVQNASPGGGGGGGFEKEYINPAGFGTCTYAIGAAGTAGSSTGPTAGGNGGDTTFTDGTTLCTAKGGKGSQVGSNSGPKPGGDGGAISTNGDINLAGYPGDPTWLASATSSTTWQAGRGAPGPFGGGGGNIRDNNNAAGTAGQTSGSGAGGSTSSGGGNELNGAAGKAGEIIIWEYSS